MQHHVVSSVWRYGPLLWKDSARPSQRRAAGIESFRQSHSYRPIATAIGRTIDGHARRAVREAAQLDPHSDIVAFDQHRFTIDLDRYAI